MAYVASGRRATVPAERYDAVPRLRFDQLGTSLFVTVGGVGTTAAAVAQMLPAEEDRLAVVMGHADIALVPEFAEQLHQWLPLGWDSVRLVAPYAATAVGDAPPPAQELADLVGIEVLAPDGPLLAAPCGSLFVLDTPDGTENGLWRRFRPGRAPEATGRRFPVPEWQRDLAAFKDPGIAGVVIEEVPAGLWVHWPGEADPTDLAYSVPVQHSTMALVVSRAGDPPLRTGDLRRLLEALPERLQDRLAVVPYGDTPVAEAQLGAVVSLAANRTLRVRNGMPLHITGSHGRHVVAVGSDGLPTWRPFARELAWRPHGGARVLSWFAPADYMLPAGHAQLMLNERWLVEVIEAGLWVREADRLDGAAVVRQLPLDSGHCTVVVGVAEDDPAQPPWRAIRRLLKRMPAEARERLRLALPDSAGPHILRAAVKACRRVLGDEEPVVLLAPDGTLVSRHAHARRRPRAGAPSQPAGAFTAIRDAVAAAPEVVRSQWGTHSDDEEEIYRLMHFVDEIRRTRAWDESPADGGRADRPAQPSRERTPDLPAAEAEQPGDSGALEEVRAASGRHDRDADRPVDPPELPPVVSVPDRVISERRSTVPRAAPPAEEGAAQSRRRRQSATAGDDSGPESPADRDDRGDPGAEGEIS